MGTTPLQTGKLPGEGKAVGSKTEVYVPGAGYCVGTGSGAHDHSPLTLLAVPSKPQKYAANGTHIPFEIAMLPGPTVGLNISVVMKSSLSRWLCTTEYSSTDVGASTVENVAEEPGFAVGTGAGLGILVPSKYLVYMGQPSSSNFPAVFPGGGVGTGLGGVMVAA